MRLAAIKLHDVIFLARYAAHIMVLLLTFIVSQVYGVDFSSYLKPQAVATPFPVAADTPVWEWGDASEEGAAFLSWESLPRTFIAERPAAARLDPITYEVREGDNPSIIAARFGLQPSSIVWSNPQDEQDPDLYLLNIGQTLVIPPVDGLVHQVTEGDTLAAIAEKYEVEAAAIVAYPSNKLDSESTPLILGQQLVVPGGRVPYVPPPPPPPPPAPVVTAPPPAPAPAPAASSSSSSSSSTTARSSSTSSSSSSSTSASSSSSSSSSSYSGATGYLRWPVTGRITTNPSNWHMALDIANKLGTPVYAADGGRVIYAGWDNTGYGYMVLIDHGNGLRTQYAHFSYYYVSYGDYVNKGTMIGKVGSTGNSTGPHLHFEVRQYNRNGWWRVNPWNYLP